MPRKAKPKSGKQEPSNVQLARAFLFSHPLFSPLAKAVYLTETANKVCPANGLAAVTSSGHIYTNPAKRLSTEEWIYVLAHCLLHLGFGHAYEKERFPLWNAACCAYVHKYLQDLKLGQIPGELAGKFELNAQNETALFEKFCREGTIPPDLQNLGVAGPGHQDMIYNAESSGWICRHKSFEDLLAEGLVTAVNSALDVAGGARGHLGASASLRSPAMQARSYLISSFPLLGALAASFEIVEDQQVCHNLAVSIAAVDPQLKEIYVNPAAGLDTQQLRFVLAHEFLHVGLRHDQRRQGRDGQLWNVACDYVINGWLIEMKVGELPPHGLLYDPSLKGMSAEEIYLLICQDLRRFRKLQTLRGSCDCDIIERKAPDFWNRPEGMTLDEFYRRCLAEGLRFHEEQFRGFLPSGLVEEIKALSQPPIPWDVELAQWFDNYFAPIEMKRSYMRPSRRQASSPEIPRPSYVEKENQMDGRTFGVLLDTSGSMDRSLLAKALGSIASYSISRDVPMLRLVFCDACAYDEGYVSAESVASRVRIRGRGGTVLQPGIELLESAPDFPEKGPILIITDGDCDRLSIRREHAFLIPYGHHLPFTPRGPVFRIK